MPCRRSPSCYGPSWLASRAYTGFVPSLRPKARPMGRFSCCVSLTSTAFFRTISADGSSSQKQPIFINFFYQVLKYFIIFTNITINNIYIQSHNYTTIHFHQTDRWNGPCPGRAACLGGGPSTTWSLGPCSGLGQIIGPWARPPGHGLHGHV